MTCKASKIVLSIALWRSGRKHGREGHNASDASPPTGWCKFNVEELAKGKPRVVGKGSLLHDNYGGMKMFF